MKIENHAPYVRRGVTQLMYVGDSDAVDAATSQDPAELAIGAAAAIAAYKSAGAARLVLGGIAALIGLRALQRAHVTPAV